MISADCGQFEQASVSKRYRGLKLQSNGTATDLTVNSGGANITLHLEPGELHSGVCTIVSGTLTGVIGYLVVG